MTEGDSLRSHGTHYARIGLFFGLWVSLRSYRFFFVYVTHFVRVGFVPVTHFVRVGLATLV